MTNIINAFNDVDRKDIPSKEGVAGNTLLDRLASVQIGIGSKVFRADDSGIWLGAERFASAPFRVDMLGNLTATSASFPNINNISIFSQAAIPTSEAIGDLWFDTDDGNRLYRAGMVGADQIAVGEWEEVTPEGGVTVFAQAAIPTSLLVGDLWFDTDDGNKEYRAASVGADQIIAGEWELVSTTGISVFAQDGIPTSTAVGDLWVDTNDGNALYRAASVGADQITAGEWELVTPEGGITVFAQDAIPTSTAVGDLWYDTNDSNKPYRAASVGADQITAGEWELVNDLRAADALLKAGTTQALTGNFNLNDSNVLIDGANKRITISDGTNTRILIGYQSGGF